MPFLFGYSGQSCFKTCDASRSPTREGSIVIHTSTPALTHTCVCTPISTLGRGETHIEWLLNGREELRGERDGARERAHEREREREVSSHVQDQKVKRQISLLSPKEASPSEGSVRRLRNRRNTLLLWWFKGDMTSRSSLKSQLVSDSVSQLWREFLLSDAWLCSGGLQPGGLTTEKGIKGRSRNKSLLIPPPTPHPLTRRSEQELFLLGSSFPWTWMDLWLCDEDIGWTLTARFFNVLLTVSHR